MLPRMLEISSMVYLSTVINFYYVILILMKPISTMSYMSQSYIISQSHG